MLRTHETLLKQSLSGRLAKQKLIESVSAVLQKERRTKQLRLCGVADALSRDPGIVLMLCSGSLLVGCACASTSHEWAWTGATGLALVAISLFNAALVARERHLTSVELIIRIEQWLSRVAQQSVLFRGHSSSSEPRPGSISVMRDGVWVQMHRNLLVQGDVVRLHTGEAAPAACVPALQSWLGGLAAGESCGPPTGVSFDELLAASAERGASFFVLAEDVAATRAAVILASPRRQVRTPLEEELPCCPADLLTC